MCYYFLIKFIYNFDTIKFIFLMVPFYFYFVIFDYSSANYSGLYSFKVWEELNEILSIYKLSFNKFIDNDILTIIKKFIDNYSSFLNTLSLEQLGALAHITSSIFILMCLFSIIVIIFSDYLLNILKLEEKYPKIGKIIRLRKTFQKYYLILNFILIIVTLLAVIFVDLNVLYLNT